jgi:hypothetical protein
MSVVIRNQENRRVHSSTGFPLVDGMGVVIVRDRRILPTRRKSRYGLEDFKVILSKMADS